MALEPLPQQIAERTVPEVLAHHARQRPDAIALVVAGDAGESDLRVTYGELRRAADALAGAWSQAGVGQGDRVAILLGNDCAYEAHVAYHAAHLLGAINVPLNTLYVARELEHVIGFTEPKVLLYDLRSVKRIEQLEIPDSVKVHAIVTGRGRAGLPDGRHADAIGQAIAAGGHAPPLRVSEEQDADWLFTSGTTGNPKAVAFTHANAVACGHQASALWGLSADSIYQSSAPFFTSTGSHTNLLGCLVAGCVNVIEPEFNVRRTLQRIERLRTTSIFLISGALALLLQRLDDRELDTYDLSCLRRVCYGGQSMAPSFHQLVEQRLGEGGRGLQLVHLYGLTEGGTSGMKLAPQLHAMAVREHCGAHGLTVGKEGFNDWVKWRVVGEDDQPAPPGMAGEVLFRGPAVMSRYVNEPEATASALRGGWLHTGDVGVVDERGFLYFVDRKKQIIRRGGLNISSAEVEGVLSEHPGILEAAVVGQPNPILEEEIRAVVVAREGAQIDAEDVIAHCSSRLAPYKVPVRVDFVDRLPRNAMGRVMKSVLAGADAGLASASGISSS